MIVQDDLRVKWFGSAAIEIGNKDQTQILQYNAHYKHFQPF